MSNTYTAIFERDGDWHIAYCPEVPGANGLGHTKQEAQASLANAIELIFHDRPDCLAIKICKTLSIPEIGE